MLSSNSKMPLVALKRIPQLELKNLCRVLWGWEYCTNCTTGEACIGASCSWSRKLELNLFLQFYTNETSGSIQEVFACSRSALKTHEDLTNIIQLLKEKSHVPRSILTKEHWQRYKMDSQPSCKDHEHAFEVAIGVMTMVDCSAKCRSWSQCELGLTPAVWHNDQSLEQFMELAIPRGKSPLLVVRQLTAKRLQKAGIKFQGTNDLSNHLTLNRETGVLRIYHHTSFLKLHLKATRASDQVHLEYALQK
jgi:hypothetical protein